MTVSSDAPAGAETEPSPPDFFIVGHPKSGTTALYEMLRRHPQIFMPDLKEPRFFAEDLRSRFQGAGAGGLPQTLPEYLQLFEGALPGQRVGEASPSYLRSRTAARAIAELRPDARILAILREPASFLRSMHLELLQNHVERESDLRRALAAEVLAPGASSGACADSGSGSGSTEGAGSGSTEPLLRYTDRVRYVEQLRRYHEAFDGGQVLVLIYEDFRRDNEGTVRTVLRFLGVDDSQPIDPVEANPSVAIRSRRMDQLVRALYAGSNPASRVVGAAVRTMLPERIRGDALSSVRRRLLYGKPAPVDERLMSELRERFRGEVEQLSDYLGRPDLERLWGYER